MLRGSEEAAQDHRRLHHPARAAHASTTSYQDSGMDYLARLHPQRSAVPRRSETNGRIDDRDGAVRICSCLTTFTFAASVLKLGKLHTLVQNPYAIETLARIDMICLDKTGTITDGSMKVDGYEWIETIVHETPEDATDTEEALDLSVSRTYDVKAIVSSMVAALSDNNQTAAALRAHFGKKRVYKTKETLAVRFARTSTARSASRTKPLRWAPPK
ncbi:MAG: hypothetical protein MZU97_01520 [Bacillus subtilis]|nr:hypothetical protein [Bacillus subtilis]